MMHGFDDFRRRREELFREAASERLAKAVRSEKKMSRPRVPAPGWELRRYGDTAAGSSRSSEL